MLSAREGGDDGRRRGNSASLHVTFFMGVLVRLCEMGTVVQGDCGAVPTHPRGEGVDRWDRGFIGASVGLSAGVNFLGQTVEGEEGEEVVVGFSVGVEVGTKIWSSE